MDRNDYYGGESTSLNLNQVFFFFFSAEIKLNLIILSSLMFGLRNGDFSVFLFSFGRDSGEMTSLLRSWALAGIITSI